MWPFKKKERANHGREGEELTESHRTVPDPPAQAGKQDELAHARQLAKECAWCSALWHVTQALTADPSSGEAIGLFQTALANAGVGMVVIMSRNDKARQRCGGLLSRRDMNPAEAREVADHMVSVFYLAAVQNSVDELLKRFNAGYFRTVKALSKSDLETAAYMASALADEMLPGQKAKPAWVSLVGPEGDALTDSGITANMESLIVLLQTSNPQQWSESCMRISRIWREVGEYEQMVRNFAESAADSLNQAELAQYRDQFEIAFARNAADMKHMRNILRKPED